MLIKDQLSKNTTFSFEFFPPRTVESSSELYKTIKALKILEPSFVSITYGAGGATRDLTHDLVVKLAGENEFTVASHLTCVGSTKTELENILRRYRDNGICNIMVLRGDPVNFSEGFVPLEDGFSNASELVAFTKQLYPDMGIGVAAYPEGHPETPDRLKEMEYLKRKVDEGADYICTQMFFDNHDFYDFRERCEIAGINIPIIAGIMPVTSITMMRRMSSLALGTHIPGKLLRALLRAQDKDYFEKVGIHWATEQVRDLIDNRVNGVHFYTLNKSRATLKIYDNLGVTSSSGLSDDKNFV
ncbi:MAG: methylenetetrahydrofolate reductase [NAD(P)H] [Deltaproteobacteria bacterium]|nr:methylenetetrahydrofolate reductase [NAD(P)H] [Deltaproteobacteria bacterium]